MEPGTALAATERAGRPLSAPVGLGWLWSHPLAQRARQRLTRISPVTVLIVAIALWVAVASYHLILLHERYGTFDHDLGIWDQAVWLLSRGQARDTVRGLDVFAFHVSPALYVYVPFYWLGAGPDLLNLSMVFAYGAGAYATFRIAAHHLRNGWHALIIGLAFLVNYAGNWMVKETFHPEVIALNVLLFAYLTALRGRWRLFAALLVFALMWKEDVAFAGFMMGAILAIRGTRTVTGRAGAPGTRRWGVYAMVACCLWFILATRVVIPMSSTEGAFTDNLFGDLGASPAEIAKNTVTDPARVGEHFERSDPRHYATDLLASYGFVGLAAPLGLLMGLPQALINLLAIHNFFWTTRVHYAALPLLGVTIASAEGVARLRSVPWRRAALGLVAVGAFYTAVNWGVLPGTADYRTGIWPLTDLANQQELDAAVALPGPDDAVSASTSFVPHLAHRSEIYTFPNPWEASNWGVRSELRPDPDSVDWLVLRPVTLNDRDARTAEEVLRNPTRWVTPSDSPSRPRAAMVPSLKSAVNPAYWEVLNDTPALFVARRVRS